MNEMKFIHLLYVPTMACNLACRYCYLEENTVDRYGAYSPLETLKYTIHKLREQNVIPFNISLHGGEVTTLSPENFRELVAFIADYYEENRELLSSNGFRVGRPHIKTNLYDLMKHRDTIREYQVSISGSLDLPLSMHDQYRLTKGGKPTLSHILHNISELKEYTNHKKVSATIFREHFQHLDEMIDDIWFLHRNTCLDMNDFNFMIGFEAGADKSEICRLTPLSEDEQVELFQRMHEAFDGTELDAGVNGAWFNEFGPEYCTNCDNCGEKFFLLEKNGDIYSCVRGQKNEDFYYGNIYKDTVAYILSNGRMKIFTNHNRMPFSEECAQCSYLYLCKTGCPYVKNTYNSSKSYTCRLQQELYQNRGYEADKYREESLFSYVRQIHPDLVEQYLPTQEPTGSAVVTVDKKLLQLIAEDKKLKYIYDPEVFLLEVDGQEFKLESQILKRNRDIVMITKISQATLYVANHLLDQEAVYPDNNYLYLMCLSGDCIVYGDEQRTKQAHLFSHQIYKGVLEKKPSDRQGYYAVDLMPLLSMYREVYSKERPNNLFFTTGALRDYHYTKQKENAFYHIQAINLPFQNIEFFYIEM